MLARQDGEGVLSWLFPGFAQALRFVQWLDTRSASGPEAEQRTADTLAHLEQIREVAQPWLLLLEWQTEPDRKMAWRLLRQLGNFGEQHRPDDQRGSEFQLMAAVINLTGTSRSMPAARRFEFPVGGFGLDFRPQERHLGEESTEATLDAIERSEVSRHRAGLHSPDAKKGAIRLSCRGGLPWPRWPACAIGKPWLRWPWCCQS
jgi:hypothetical protein